MRLKYCDRALLDSWAFLRVPMVDWGFQVLQSSTDLVVLDLRHLQVTLSLKHQKNASSGVNEKKQFASSNLVKMEIDWNKDKGDTNEFTFSAMFHSPKKRKWTRKGECESNEKVKVRMEKRDNGEFTFSAVLHSPSKMLPHSWELWRGWTNIILLVQRCIKCNVRLVSFGRYQFMFLELFIYLNLVWKHHHFEH